MIDWLKRSFGPVEEPDTPNALMTKAAMHSRKMVTQARSINQNDLDPIDVQLLKIQGLTPRPWRPASIREALGVPSLFGAVSLISSTMGSLTMRALRNEVEVPPEDRPRVIVRPDPFKTAGAFFRDYGHYMATRGEAWLWTARRDSDGNALSVILVPPWEMVVEQNSRDRLRPRLLWLNRELPRDDVKLITYMPDDGSLSGPFQRGVGPLQLCGAAISVAVEAQEWAANFYADGGGSPFVIFANDELTDDPGAEETEAERFADAWNAKGNNRPRVVSRVDVEPDGVKQFEFNPNGAQMLDARMYQNGDAARMFNMPGELLEYAMSGSSLTYQNLSTIYRDFLRRCLGPHYIRPLEEVFSDLIPRALVARFDTDNLTLDDPKTRYETYQIGITAGILTAEQAQSFEGITPGDTDNAPVPFSPPQAIPDLLPVDQGRAIQEDWRCTSCNKKLAEAAGPGTRIRCRCGTVNVAEGISVRAREDDKPDLLAGFAAIVAQSNAEAAARTEALIASIASREPRIESHIDAGAVQVHVEAPQPVAPEPAQVTVNVPEREMSLDVRQQPPVVNLPAPDMTPIADALRDLGDKVDALTPQAITVPEPVVQPADMTPVARAIDDLSKKIDILNAPREKEIVRDANGKMIKIREWSEGAA